jgi:uncharacterized protein (TIGR04255 family)
VEFLLERQCTVPPRPDHLPDFDDPPVVETVLSVQFEPLPLVQTAHLGLLWDEYRPLFPKTEEGPALEPVIEQFPENPAARVGLRFRALESYPVPRIWFTNEMGNEMIQVQNDRFIKNWRKGGERDQYPHYDQTIRPHFDRDFGTFLAFLEKNELGTPRVNQCEVTYVNHILAGQGWDRFGEVDKLFTFWRSGDLVPPGPPEDLRLHVRFVIRDEEGIPVGRLHVDIQPAVRTSDNHPMYVLHLTARGQIGDGVRFFNTGREWIVATFERLTTISMHQIWRIKK